MFTDDAEALGDDEYEEEEEKEEEKNDAIPEEGDEEDQGYGRPQEKEWGTDKIPAGGKNKFCLNQSNFFNRSKGCSSQ